MNSSVLPDGHRSNLPTFNMVLYQYYLLMPPKIRTLIKELKAAGFFVREGKGSHKVFSHAQGVVVTLSGKPGSDAMYYQVQQVKDSIERVKNETK